MNKLTPSKIFILLSLLLTIFSSILNIRILRTSRFINVNYPLTDELIFSSVMRDSDSVLILLNLIISFLFLTTFSFILMKNIKFFENKNILKFFLSNTFVYLICSITFFVINLTIIYFYVNNLYSYLEIRIILFNNIFAVLLYAIFILIMLFSFVISIYIMNKHTKFGFFITIVYLFLSLIVYYYARIPLGSIHRNLQIYVNTVIFFCFTILNYSASYKLLHKFSIK